MGSGIFKDPHLLGTDHGAPPLLRTSTQVCVVSSSRTDIRDTTPHAEAPPLIEVPPVEELLPQKFPKDTVEPLVQDFPHLQGKISVWETVPQAITQIPLFYRPPRVQVIQIIFGTK
jgi:hypothetical protein